MKIRLTHKFSALLNGIDLSKVREGETVDLSARDALMLIAEGWASPASDSGVAERDQAHDQPRRKPGPSARASKKR